MNINIRAIWKNVSLAGGGGEQRTIKKTLFSCKFFGLHFFNIYYKKKHKLLKWPSHFSSDWEEKIRGLNTVCGIPINFKDKCY